MKMPTSTVNALKAHLSLNVRNVDQSIQFYRKMLGIEPSKVRTGYAKFDVQNPPLNLALNEAPQSGAAAHCRISAFRWASTEDVLATRQKWNDAGLSTHDEMQTSCCYAVQDKTWVRDPDGNEWEVFVVLEDNLAESNACCGVGEETCATPLTQISHSRGMACVTGGTRRATPYKSGAADLATPLTCLLSRSEYYGVRRFRCGGIALARLTTESTTSAAAFKVRLAFFPQLFSFGFLLGRKHCRNFRFRISHRSAHLFVKRSGARLVIGRERALTSLLAQLSQLFARQLCCFQKFARRWREPAASDRR